MPAARRDVHPARTSHDSSGRGAVTEGTRAASCLSFPACQQRVAEPRSSASPNKGPRGRTISAKPAADHLQARGNTAPFRRRSFLIPSYVRPQSTVHNPVGNAPRSARYPRLKSRSIATSSTVDYAPVIRAPATMRPPIRRHRPRGASIVYTSTQSASRHVIPFGNLPPLSAR